MMGKLLALWKLFRKGEAVANPEAWKNGQMTATVFVALVMAVVNTAKHFGIDIPLDADAANMIGVGLFTLVNITLTTITSKKVGLSTKIPIPKSDTTDYGFPVLTPEMIEDAKERLEKDRGRSKTDPLPPWFTNP